MTHTPIHPWLLLFILCTISLNMACRGDVNTVDPDKQTPKKDPPIIDPVVDPPVLPPFKPGQVTFSRLTATQYHNIVRDVFGTGLAKDTLEKDTNPHLFFNIGASSTVLTEYGAEQYETSALNLANAIFSDTMRRDALIGCTPGAADDSCAKSYMDRIGKSLFRRPMTAQEQTRWTDLAKLTGPQDPYMGLQMVTAAMLQSPKFLYRIEVGQPDPQDATRRTYTSQEMAQRLAFFLWNSAPDDELIDAATRGELLDDESIKAQTERMIKDPRTRLAVQDFFAQYLDLRRLDDVKRDPSIYPGFTPQLVEDMRTEVRLLVDHIIFRQDEDIRKLFSTQETFVNDNLANWYQLDAPSATNYAFTLVPLPQDGPRAGILTLGAFLTMNAHPTETSPTLRGKYLRERIFCQTVPDPPEDIDLNLEPDPGDQSTLRKRLEAHQTDPSCVGCHSFIDPPGYLFEHFDSAGRYRTMEGEYPIDSTGNLNGTDLDDARGLSTLLATDTVMPKCLVKQLYRHASGRLDEPGEFSALYELETTFALSGYRFQPLMRALVLSEGFRTFAAPGDTP